MLNKELRFSPSPHADGQVRADPYLYYLPALVHKRVFVTYRGYWRHHHDDREDSFRSREPRHSLRGCCAALIPDTQFCYTYTGVTNESFYLDKEGPYK
jgi:hypothetical protein